MNVAVATGRAARRARSGGASGNGRIAPVCLSCDGDSDGNSFDDRELDVGTHTIEKKSGRGTQIKENDIYALCQDACVLDSVGPPTCEIAR